VNIAVIGAGYVGLVTGAGLATLGHRVACADTNPSRVAEINAGRSFLQEPGLGELLRQGVDRGALRATTDVSTAVRGAEVALICVDTPSSPGGAINLRAIRECAESVGAALRNQQSYAVVAVKSTVVPGTTEDVVGPQVWRAAGRGRDEIGLAVNPEFSREGQAVQDFLRPDRIVIGGIDERSTTTVKAVYADVSARILSTTPRTAEVMKYTSNALLAVLISFSNEIAEICEATEGVDVTDVLQGVHLDHRLSPVRGEERIRPGILQYLWPGCGFGGSCLPKDVRALSHYARSAGVTPHLLDAAMRINEARPQFLISVLERSLGSLGGLRIAVLGLAFKPGTDDLRDSPALPVIEGLTRKGAHVAAYDPVAGPRARSLWAPTANVTICSSASEAAANAHGIVLVTAWPEFATLDWKALRGVVADNVLVDGRRLLSPRDIEQAGFRYFGVGLGR
jgi:UDPglucose 6-dehydrogenase